MDYSITGNTKMSIPITMKHCSRNDNTVNCLELLDAKIHKPDKLSLPKAVKRKIQNNILN